MSENTINPLFGKPWQNAFTFKTFKAADNKRNKLLETDNLQVKVKRRPDGVFVVKTRNSDAEKVLKNKKKTNKNTKGQG